MIRHAFLTARGASVMSNPLIRPDVQNVHAAAGTAQKSTGGPESPTRPSTHSAAGASDVSPQLSAVYYDTNAALELLSQALEQMALERRITTAAGVSARMRQIDPQFTTAATGFRSFRELLRLAEERSLVHVSKPEGGSDFLLTRAPADVTIGGPGEAPLELSRLRPDLWGALLDWSATTYVYDRRTQRTVPGDSAVTLPEGSVPTPAKSQELRQAWMQTFARGLAPELKEQLLSTLAEDPSGAAFLHMIRAQQQTRRRWEGFLRKPLLDLARDWAAEHGIPLADIVGSRSEAPAELARKPAPKSGRRGFAADAELRREILDVLGGLPLTELLKIPIPLEYSLRR